MELRPRYPLPLWHIWESKRSHGQVKIPTVAIVENMSFFVCDGCSKRHEIFQRGSGETWIDPASGKKDVHLVSRLPWSDRVDMLAFIDALDLGW